MCLSHWPFQRGLWMLEDVRPCGVQGRIEQLFESETLTNQIDYRVDRFARVFGLSSHDAEDLRQDFWTRVLWARKDYDPEMASWFTFTRAVADTYYCERARLERRRRGKGLSIVPLVEELIEVAQESRSCTAVSEDDLLEIQSELVEVSESLSDRERRVAAMLKTHSKAQCARELGIPRGTVSRIVTRISDKLAPKTWVVS